MRGWAPVLIAVVGSLCCAGRPVTLARAADPAPAAAASSHAEELKTKFKAFIDTWMEKLRARERHNIAHIQWKPGERGVVGEYVGYDTTNVEVQDIRNPDSKSPIGRVVYMELKLRLSGASEVDALAQTPEIVERTEVTELFRYERGSWIY